MGMAFDRMAKFIDGMPACELKDMADQLARVSNLFTMQTKDLKDLEEEKYDMFFLPYRSMILEDDIGCVVIHDEVANSLGFESPRLWLIFGWAGIPCVESLSWVRVSSARKDTIDPALIAEMNAALPYVGLNNDNYIYAVNPGLVALMRNGKYRILDHDDTDVFTKGNRSFLSTQITAKMAEIVLINTPCRLPVDKIPHTITHHDGTRIPRSHERPTTTMMTVPHIRQLMGEREPTGKAGTPKRPHSRRAHPRRLGKNTYCPGKYIIVRETYIGLREKIIGKHTYKVRTGKQQEDTLGTP